MGDDPSRASEPRIVINERQFNCYGKEWWTEDGKHIDLVFVDSPNFRYLPEYVKYKTIEGEEMVTGMNYIETCLKDPSVLDVFDKIAKSFKPVPPVAK